MSGFVGIVHLDGMPVDRGVLQHLVDGLTARGPDAQAVWIEGAIGLGHTLLRTTKEARGEQQPCSLDGHTWIVAHARLDDRERLVSVLAAREPAAGDLAGRPDCELILRAYGAWGERCVDHLLGDFAFAIWDGARRTLFCARDHHGMRLFYYALVGRCLLFSNTLTCLRRHPLVRACLNEQAVGDFLLFSVNYDPATTFFKDVARLPGGHLLRVVDGRVQQRRYWTLPVQELSRHRRPEEYLEQFRQLLQQAVADRLRLRDVSLLMSGGLDSTSLAAAAREGADQRGQAVQLRALTGVFSRMVADQEEQFAAAVASALGVRLELLRFTLDMIAGVWKRPDQQPPEPQALILTLGTVFRQAQAEVDRVLLFGHGSDHALRWSSNAGALLQTQPPWEVLAGYVQTRRMLDQLPPLSLGLGLRKRLARRRDPRLDGTWLPGMLHPIRYPSWLHAGFERTLALPERWQQVVQGARPRIASPRADAYWFYNSPHEGALREWVDPSISGALTEVRLPFLDLRLLQFLLALPPLPWCYDKGVIRLAMRERLPDVVLQRSKTSLPQNPFFMLLANESEPLQRVAAMPELQPYVDPARLLQAGAAGDAAWQAPLSLRLLSLGYWLRAQT